MRILLAEDDSSVRLLLSRYLESIGYELLQAANGLIAWEILQKEKVDLIVSDWIMPEMDGIQLLRKVRERENSEYIYFIMITGLSTPEDLVSGVEAGADDFIKKPIQTSELGVRVLSGLRVISLERSLRNRNHQLEELNRRIMRDLNNAAEMQQRLLPRAFQSHEKYSFHYRFIPCEELAGDTLNIIQLDKRYIALYILDVAGHGISAALLAFTLSRMLSADPGQSILYESGGEGRADPRIRQPEEVIRYLNRAFPVDSADTQFFTIAYGLLDTKMDRLQIVSAGHTGILYMDGHNSPVNFYSTGLPVGLDPNARYETLTIDITPSSRVYIYSDGLTESRNSQDEYFGHERIRGLLHTQTRENIGNAVNSLIKKTMEWQEGGPFRDDVSIIGLERRRSNDYVTRQGKLSLKIRFASELKLVSRAVEDVLYFFREHNLPLQLFNLNLMLREALNNAVIHGNTSSPGKFVYLEVLLSKKRVVIQVRDEGEGFDWKGKMAEAGSSTPGENGMGLDIMAASDFSVRYNEKGNQLFLEKQLK